MSGDGDTAGYLLPESQVFSVLRVGNYLAVRRAAGSFKTWLFLSHLGVSTDTHPTMQRHCTFYTIAKF